MFIKGKLLIRKSGSSGIFTNTILCLVTSRIVLLFGLLSLSAVAANKILWPLLNETDFYLLLYVVDFLTYAFFLYLFVNIARVVSSKVTESSGARGWGRIYLLIVFMCTANLMLDYFAEKIEDRVIAYGTTVAVNSLEFLFFIFLIRFSVTQTKTARSMIEAFLILLRGLHWFVLVFLIFVAIGYCSLMIFVYFKVEPIYSRMFSDVSLIAIRYINHIVLVALILQVGVKVDVSAREISRISTSSDKRIEDKR